ncbi:MAG: hypothetical protein AAF799_10495 [Myxococcota bacterium]
MTVPLGLLLLVSDIAWEAPPSCPSAAAVQQRLAKYVGDRTLPSDVSATATVRASETQWSLKLVLHAQEETRVRRMVSDDCETLADATALVVATFVDPLQVETTVGVVPSNEVGPAEDAVPSPTPAADSETARTREPVIAEQGSDARESSPAPETYYGLRAGALAGRATQAELDLGPELAFSWQRGVARLEVGVFALVPRLRPVPDRDAVTLRQWALGGRARVGLVMPLHRRLELPLSLGVELAPVVARGVGVAEPTTVSSPWVAASVSAHLVWRPAPPWGVWLGGEGLVGLARPQFTVDGAGPLATGAGGLRAMVGIERRWN